MVSTATQQALASKSSVSLLDTSLIAFVYSKYLSKDLSMFIISLTYQVPLEQIDAFIPQHVEYLNQQYTKGNFILSGRKEPRTGGVIISTIRDRQQLDDVLAQDPFHREGLASYDITEVIPTKASQELEFLI